MILLKVVAMLLIVGGMFAAVAGAFRQEGKIFIYGFLAMAIGITLW